MIGNARNTAPNSASLSLVKKNSCGPVKIMFTLSPPCAQR